MLHPLERVEMRGEDHARRVARRFDVDLHTSNGIAVAWRPVIFDDGVFDHEPGRCVDLDHVPGAVEPFAALGSRHEVGDACAGCEVVMLEGGRESWRTPPPLEEARVGPQLPHVGDGRLELRSDDHCLGLWVLFDIPNGHLLPFSVVSLSTSWKRWRRARHTASSSSRSLCARRSWLTSPCTS